MKGLNKLAQLVARFSRVFSALDGATGTADAVPGLFTTQGAFFDQTLWRSHTLLSPRVNE